MEDSFEKLSIKENGLTDKDKKILFKYISVGQRDECSKSSPEAYKLNMEVPYVLDSCTISQSANSIDFFIDNYFWKCTNEGQITRGNTEDDSQTRTFQTEMSKEEYMEKLVKMYLNREGTQINHLKIKNHPYGLEGIAPMKIVNFQWHCDIVSDRYDYTTWFSCIRNNTLTKADIQLSSSCHNQIFLEPVLLGAETLIVKCPQSFAPQTVQNFHGLNLELSFSSITLGILEAFREKWESGWADGEGKLELEVKEREAKSLLIVFLLENLPWVYFSGTKDGVYERTSQTGGRIKFIFSAGEPQDQ